MKSEYVAWSSGFDSLGGGTLVVILIFHEKRSKIGSNLTAMTNEAIFRLFRCSWIKYQKIVARFCL